MCGAGVGRSGARMDEVGVRVRHKALHHGRDQLSEVGHDEMCIRGDGDEARDTKRSVRVASGRQGEVRHLDQARFAPAP